MLSHRDKVDTRECKGYESSKEEFACRDELANEINWTDKIHSKQSLNSYSSFISTKSVSNGPELIVR